MVARGTFGGACRRLCPVTPVVAGSLCASALLSARQHPNFAVSHDDIAAASRAPQEPVRQPQVPADMAPIGTQPFTNRRNPPSYRKLSDAEFARYDLGMAVFNTQFVPAGTPNAGRRAGVGPLFNSSSCDSCHNNGARGRGPTEDGPAPSPLVMQLATTPTKNPTDPEGDPVYGRVLNTISLEGLPPEGVAMIRYEEISGHYPDGSAWSLRAPHYTLTNLRYGPLSPQTIVKPRLAPALFGAGLLDAASEDSRYLVGRGRTPLGFRQARFAESPAMAASDGKRAPSLSATKQHARLRARWASLPQICAVTIAPRPRRPVNNNQRRIARSLGRCLQRRTQLSTLARRPASPTPHSIPDLDADTSLNSVVSVHPPQLQVALTDDAGKDFSAVIAPYTDLRLHDLGARLADETVAGQKVASKWRTAPLWGLGYRMSLERFPTFLHDGRARSAEEAILWHDGEAASSQNPL